MRLPIPVFLLLIGIAPCIAQSTAADLQARLLHQPLYLRGQWSSDKLHFDSGGKPTGGQTILPFTLSGIDIGSVEVSAKGLRLKANRVGLVFDGLVPRRVRLNDGAMHLEVDPPQSGDYTPALDAMLTANLSDFVPRFPDYWHDYGVRLLANDLAPSPPKPPLDKAGVRRIGGGVKAPVVIFAPEPRYTSYAKRQGVSGNCLVYLQVDKDGAPTHLKILRPLGLGLDEQSVDAVRHYKFKPAEENGQPVVVEMNVEVNFQIF